MTAIDKMYDNYNILVDAGDKITEHEDKYLEILNSVKGSPNEKRLASQFITKFFKHFPAHYNSAIDALLDLCEDDDINIRKQAIKDLPSICRDCKEYVPRITDILAQLLLAQDATELQIVNNSLITVCKLDPKGFLGGIFLQIEAGEDITRERVIKFLAAKMKTLPEDTWTKEDEEFILSEGRKALQDCTKDEFVCLLSLLSSLKISKTITAQQVLVDMITEHAELDAPLNPAETEQIEKFIMCVRAAIPHFSPFVPSNAFVQFICSQIIPCMNEIVSLAIENPNIEVEILQQLAELSAFIQPTNTNLPINLDECQEVVFSKLLEYMPSPSLSTDVEEKSEEPSLQLFPLESLMFTLYTLSVINPEFNSKVNEDRMKDYKLRLQYLARLIQSHIKKAKEVPSADKKVDNESDDVLSKAIALRTATNINTLIKELFHPKPASKSSVTLSWKPIKTKSAAIKRSNSTADTTVAQTATKLEDATTNSSNPKRKPITAPEDSESSKKRQRQLYAPPSGKFSYNFRGGYSNNRGRGRGTGGFRGTNRGRNNRYSKRYSY